MSNFKGLLYLPIFCPTVYLIQSLEFLNYWLKAYLIALWQEDSLQATREDPELHAIFPWKF